MRTISFIFSLVNIIYLSLLFSCATPLGKVQQATLNVTEPEILRVVRDGDIEKVTKEIQKGNNINARDQFGNTALMLAAQNGRSEIVSLLVENGADINVRNNNNLNALVFLTLYQEYGEVLMLGRTEFRGFGVTLDGHIQVAEYLIDKGIDVNSKVGKNGWSTALLQAVNLDKTSLVELLLRKGADPDLRNDLGQTPLMVGAYRGNKTIVELLINKGAHINIKEQQGRTALDVASNEDVKLILLNYGAKSGKEIK